MLKFLIIVRNLFIALIAAIGILTFFVIVIKGGTYIHGLVSTYFYGIIYSICSVVLVAIASTTIVIIKNIIHEPCFDYQLKKRVAEITVEREQKADSVLFDCIRREHNLDYNEKNLKLEIEKNSKILDDIAQEREKYKVEANTILKQKEEDLAKRIKNVEEKEALLVEREKNIEAREAKYKAYIENIDSLTAKNKELRTEIQTLHSTVEIARKALASQNLDAARAALAKKKR